jgi:CheY-like chemotaxis protein
VNQRLISKILEKMGHAVVVVNDGAAALHTLEQQEFDLIAMDMQMPVMDGIEATQKIRLNELGSARHMPIIAITANAFDDDRRKCFEAGMDGYVVKPVTAQAISDEVERVMALFNEKQPETRPKMKAMNLRAIWTFVEGLSAAGTPNPIFVVFQSLREITRL